MSPYPASQFPSGMSPAPCPWRAEVAATLRLSWPLILTSLAEIAIMTTDVLMMGWLGPAALAAGNLGVNLYHAVFVLGFGIASATAPLMAQALGRRKHEVRDVRRSVRQGFWACAATCLPSWLFLWHGETVLALMGQDPALAAAAGTYLRVMMWGLLPLLWFMVLRSFVSALERPLPALLVTVGAIGINAFSNWVLMFGNLGAPALGLTGAGISSTIAGATLFLGLLAYIHADRRMRRYKLLGRVWRPDWPRFRELWRIGLPIATTFGFEMLVFNACAFLMGLISTNALAAHAIAMQISGFTFMVVMGLAQAATVRVGRAVGRGDPAAAGRAGWVALALGGGFMTVMAVLLLTVPAPIVGLFLDEGAPGTAEVAALAISFLAVAALFQVVDGGQAIGQGCLRGLKDTRVPMIYAGVGYWVLGLPIGAFLAFRTGMAGLGLWVGLAVGLGIVAVLVVMRWARRDRLNLVGHPVARPNTSAADAVRP